MKKLTKQERIKIIKSQYQEQNNKSRCGIEFNDKTLEIEMICFCIIDKEKNIKGKKYITKYASEAFKKKIP